MSLAIETSPAQEWATAAAHLGGASLVVNPATWDDYEELLTELGPSYDVRVFYDRRKIEIMPPVYKHELSVSGIHSLVTLLSDELDIDIQPSGSTTLRRRLKEAGAEPDDGFHIQHARQVIGKKELDLSCDPPPDIIVEVDRTSSSLDRFAIYARLGVPEIWRLHGETVRFHLLEGETYRETTTSRAFPFLTAPVISRFLAQGLAEGERLAAKAFRVWVRANCRQP